VSFKGIQSERQQGIAIRILAYKYCYLNLMIHAKYFETVFLTQIWGKK
jgi:hypothetical protein